MILAFSGRAAFYPDDPVATRGHTTCARSRL